MQALQTPALQTMFVPQVVPFGLAAPSTHVCVPVAQDVVPSWQSVSGFVVQAIPAVQETHAPALQTMFVPQLVPFGSSVVVLTHTEVPVSHEVTPVRQGSGSVAQASPAVQETQVPALQTMSVPQLVPFGFAVPSTQVCVPVA
ncbi:MAG TPA: hypothetical protein VLS93_09480, partial [Anaeromyxobacteraceae bacterium]|nr:hypothetical protein [Anaeromyxobacteraceae bacterium]